MKQTSIAVLSLFLLIFVIIMIGCQTDQDEKMDAAQTADQNNNEVDGLESANQEASHDDPDLLIYTSIYPLYDFTREIAGDQAEVVNLIPPGQEPHHYEPTVTDIKHLHEADMCIYDGGNFESWIEDIVSAVDQDDLLLVNTTEHIHEHIHINAGDQSAKHAEHVEDERDHGHEEGHDHGRADNHDHRDEDGRDHSHEDGHDHGDIDPHVWLDPVLAKQQAEVIKQALIEADPDHEDMYEEHFRQLADKFDQLDEDFREMSANIERRDFVVSHEAFTHLADRYDLNQVGITGLSPSNEPSPKQVRQIVEFVETHGIEYILFENQVTPNIVKVVQEEAGVDSLVLHNMEVVTEEEISQGADYFSFMEHNLKVLRQALGYGQQ